MTAVPNAPTVQPVFSRAEIESMTSFRFTDPNPEMGRTYAESAFRDLPEFVQDIVEDVIDLSAWKWNVLVELGQVLEFTGTFRYTIPRSLPCVQRLARRGEGRSGFCPECDGSLVMIDTDGSYTGELGTPVICTCVNWAVHLHRPEVAA
ncbi:hypothetical protein [Saccharopolyspora spinosa]|uniref:Uncharacterized protein n=1 Tax=Saccharopolyspora spinosa TaxID=60894 RepID=A0A2N3XS79_SACSN|nr:hypothetical protein [Saccharopolyspora spinosa]PKW13492.1 hypothetical protein A8926_1026 [Saccharopolyspora spinosa]PKW19917.1 hypothetical protein A8926_8121 [Saccharopolyspora spinosa]